MDAVAQGLYYLDSSALAALLKELSKQGQLKRSVEIFDWLRSLAPSHDLAGLCDLYTYTTMISQVSHSARAISRILVWQEIRPQITRSDAFVGEKLVQTCGNVRSAKIVKMCLSGSKVCLRSQYLVLFS